jgi:hypothetical protein
MGGVKRKSKEAKDQKCQLQTGEIGPYYGLLYDLF